MNRRYSAMPEVIVSFDCDDSNETITITRGDFEAEIFMSDDETNIEAVGMSDAPVIEVSSEGVLIKR